MKAGHSDREAIAEVLQDSGVCQVIGDPERAVRPSEVEARLSESEERLSDSQIGRASCRERV